MWKLTGVTAMLWSYRELTDKWFYLDIQAIVR